MFEFDQNKNCVIESSIRKSYFLPKQYKNVIKLTKEQVEFIENVIVYGDSKPSGFMKTHLDWKYTSIKTMIVSFELNTLEEEFVANIDNSWKKYRKEKENVLSIDYKSWVLKSCEKRNKRFKDWLNILNNSSNNFEVPQISIENFDWEQITSSSEYLAQFFLSSGKLN